MAISKISTYPIPKPESYPDNKTDWQLDPARAVLLIHDMQRYFINFYDTESELITTVIDHLAQLKTWARQNQVPVVYTAQPYEQPATDRALLNAMWGPGLPASTIDQQKIVDQLLPDDDDVILTKWRYSAFKRSDLLKQMQGWGRDQLIIGGVYAHIGCMITAVEAFMNDIQAFLVADAVADFSEKEHRLALKYVSSRCGQVLDTKTVLECQSMAITQAWLDKKVKILIDEEDIEPEENLILYGLDSLRIMQFAAELKTLGIYVNFEELARIPTLSNWWLLINSRQENTG